MNEDSIVGGQKTMQRNVSLQLCVKEVAESVKKIKKEEGKKSLGTSLLLLCISSTTGNVKFGTKGNW